ncbi:DUF4251 domain-containing protein [Marinifilum sp. D714]|uniref:DUF4251 domain-containing protein n=1 Tax=Marinifilum sp. D714 TaxID=2937523 RepID=UPI0027C6CABE|nr:DUF4251 domain-containing protein [Marinifilum sp. D714]MDQ2179430.1 DUF4251 domain-containing protein [Marinifilum sp. D714]
MKNIKLIVVIICLLASANSFAQLSGKAKRQQKKEFKRQEIEQMISNQKFTFIPRSLTTSSGYTKDLNFSYELELNQDSTKAYLPFWGKAHIAKINDEGGILFETTANDLEIKNLNKKGYEIKFKAKGKEDTYQIKLQVSKQGYTNLFITSNNKSHISYYGHIEAINEK